MARNEQVQAQIYRCFFDRLSVDFLTLDVDSTVITCYGQQQRVTKGYNPGNLGNKRVGWLRADSGCFDDAIIKFLGGKSIAYTISA